MTGSHEQTAKLRRDRKGELHAVSEKSNYYKFSLTDVEKFSLLQLHSLRLSRFPKDKRFSTSISIIARFKIVEKFNDDGEIINILSRLLLFDEIGRA
jgi:hypothetical protein